MRVWSAGYFALDANLHGHAHDATYACCFHVLIHWWAHHLDVQHSLVEVTEGGQCYMTVDERGTRREYESLHDLVTQNCQLRQLYPDIPKEQVFKGKAPAAPEIETEGAPEARRENGYALGAAS